MPFCSFHRLSPPLHSASSELLKAVGPSSPRVAAPTAALPPRFCWTQVQPLSTLPRPHRKTVLESSAARCCLHSRLPPRLARTAGQAEAAWTLAGRWQEALVAAWAPPLQMAQAEAAWTLAGRPRPTAPERLASPAAQVKPLAQWHPPASGRWSVFRDQCRLAPCVHRCGHGG